MWALLYDDGTSLTTVSERIANSLAEAERQRGRHVTVHRLDVDVDDDEVEPEPIRPAGWPASPEPASEPEPDLEPELTLEPGPAGEPELAVEPELTPAADPTRTPGPTLDSDPTQAEESAQATEPAHAEEPASVPEPASEAAHPVFTREPEPARAARPTRPRRLLLYALTAASILVAAAAADHWDAVPRIGATPSSSPTQVSGPSHQPQLLPPLDQPPVMHFSNALSNRPKPRPRSATGKSSRSGRAIARGGSQ